MYSCCVSIAWFSYSSVEEKYGERLVLELLLTVWRYGWRFRVIRETMW